MVENKTGEQLRITVEEIEHDSSHELGVDPGLVKDGVEAHLQALLAEHVELLGTGYTLVRREYMTAIGPVDLLCRDEQGRSVAVEIKRRGEIDGVEQLTRYLELLNRDTRAGARRRSLRRPADQAAGADTGHRPRDPLRDFGLRQDARHGQRRVPAVLTPRLDGMPRRRTPPRRQRSSPPLPRRAGSRPDRTATNTRYGRSPASRATKIYRCPGCDHEIVTGTAHLVVWPADMGDSAADDRRHWHTPCWTHRATRGPTRRWS